MKRHTLECLREYTTAVLATVTQDGKPHAATMYFSVDDDLNLFFLSLEHTQKVRNIEVNPDVAVVVGFGPEKLTIQIGGKAEITQTIDPEVFWRVVEENPRFAEDQSIPPALLSKLSRLSKDPFVIIKVKPMWLSCLNYDIEGHPDSYFHDFQKMTLD